LYVNHEYESQSKPRGIVSNSLWLLESSTNSLMSLDFPKRSARKILERIIPPPSGGRDKLHFIRFQLGSLSESLTTINKYYLITFIIFDFTNEILATKFDVFIGETTVSKKFKWQC